LRQDFRIGGDGESADVEEINSLFTVVEQIAKVGGGGARVVGFIWKPKVVVAIVLAPSSGIRSGISSLNASCLSNSSFCPWGDE